MKKRRQFLHSEVTVIKYKDGKPASEEKISKSKLKKHKIPWITGMQSVRRHQAKCRAYELKKAAVISETKLYDALKAEIAQLPYFQKFPKFNCPVFYDKENYYIIDIFFNDKKVAVEVDGAHHKQQKAYDDRRDKRLADMGIRTIRFPAVQCINNPAKVARTILAKIKTV